MIQIYHWHSEVLRRYTRGDIIVAAESPYAARAKVLAEIAVWETCFRNAPEKVCEMCGETDSTAKPYNFLDRIGSKFAFRKPDEDDLEALVNLFIALRAEIEGDPLHAEILWMPGST